MHDFFLGGILDLSPCVGWGCALLDRSDRQRAVVGLSAPMQAVPILTGAGELPRGASH